MLPSNEVLVTFAEADSEPSAVAFVDEPELERRKKTGCRSMRDVVQLDPSDLGRIDDT